jgi:Tol biopolymer transport system component/DNA-binding winged helix-turn-helix (wHTH) protein
MSLDLSLNFPDFNIGMENGNKTGIYEFDCFCLDAGKLMLYRDRVEISMPPKMVKTLAVLIDSPGTILSKDELIERIWSDTIVDESNLSQHLHHLRKVLGQRSDGRPYIETLRRRGYRFNGDVKYSARPKANAPALADVRKPPSPGSPVEREGNVLRLVDWNPPADRTRKIARVESEKVTPIKDRSKGLRVAAAITAVAAIIMAAVLFQYRSSAETGLQAKNEISFLRLTNGIKPVDVAISPDGDYFVYHEVGDDGERLWLQQVGQSNRIEIGRQSEYFYSAKTFSPDAKFLFYLAVEKTGETSLHRVPTIGGPAMKILENIRGPISFSPDGRRFVFIQDDKPHDTTALVVAEIENSTEKIILERSTENALVGSPAWSPDGTKIVFASIDPDNTVALYETTLSGDPIRRLSPEKWDNVYRIVWTHDGRGLAMIATRVGDGYSTRRNQVYYVSYPSGESLRLTSDGSWHQEWSLGVTRDDAIIAAPFNRSSQIWSLDANGDATSAIQISQGLTDGRAGLAPLRDGTIGFISRIGEQVNIWSMNADGSGRRQLSSDGPMIVEELRADPKGRYLIFSGFKDGNSHLYRCDIDGRNLMQLTFDDRQPVDSTVAPDGDWVVYHSDISKGVAGKPKLFRISLDGGDPERFGETECSSPNYSPDGNLISCIRGKEILILSGADGSPIHSYTIPPYAKVNFGARWTPDGRGVIYISNAKGFSNLWIQPLDGESPRQLTSFTGGDIYNYAFSFDGTRLFVARGQQISDAVLIRNYR